MRAAPTLATPALARGLAAVLVAVLAGTGCRRAAEPPLAPLQRVVLISIDTLRPDHLGVYGYARPTSPKLDAFAAGGVVFEDATATSPWTLPSHATMLTGLNPGRHGLVSHQSQLPASVATVGEILAGHGFATAAVVNSQNLSPTFGLQRGFQQYRYEKENVAQREPSTVITDQAIAWLREHEGRRFFLFVHYYDVHSDYVSRPEYERQFVRPYTGPADGTTAQMAQMRRTTVTFDATDAQHLIDLYDAGIRQMDDEIARLIAALGSAEDTLVVITSDHGEEFLEHGSLLHGRTQYEEVVRIPLIVRGSGVPRGTRVATTVSLIDVVPTILAAAGVPIPAGLDGADLAPTWRGGGQDLGSRYLTCEADHNNVEPDMMRAVRHRTHKFHFNRVTGQTMLFDLTTDPGERTDVAAGAPEVATDLRAQLERYRSQRSASGEHVEMSPEQIERLKSLGYLR